MHLATSAKFKIRLLFVALFAALYAGAQSHPQLLDLTQETPPKTPTGKGASGSGGLVGSVRGGPPIFKVTLLDVRQSSAPVGGQITFELAITNDSKQSVILPWTGNADLADYYSNPPNREGRKICDVTLVLRNPPGRDIQLTGKGIFGRLNRPETIRVLNPGETVRIRAVSSVFSTDENERAELVAKLPRTFTVYGQFSYHEGGPDPGQTIYNSGNEKEETITR